MIGEELRRLLTWEERHRRLVSRLLIVVAATALVDALGTIAVYLAERHAQHTQIASVGDALFFASVQLLTVSSQIQNPFTAWGRAVDVVLEVWAVIVVAGSAGAFAAFFQKSD